ncbi:MAG: PHP domain-containing protein [Oscillospiraceae bacterium]|nr:PHP domain-containing protein [Oscillospiraceae bacterium]
MKADLHIHTTASDGSDTAAQVLAKAAARGVGILAITDHDTIDGAVSVTDVPAGLRFIRGIEFSCAFPGGKCHILGYGYDPGDPVFLAALEEGRRLRQEKTQKRIAFLAERFGILLTEEEAAWLRRQKSPGKPHLGNILVKRGLAPDRDTAIRDYINPCRGGAGRIGAETAIRSILHAGGIPVWAHPLGGEGERRLTPAEFNARLAILMEYGIRGLECCYSRYDRPDTAFLLQQAAQHGLLVSGGSDYHGSNKVGIELGMLNADNTAVDSAALTVLQALR